MESWTFGTECPHPAYANFKKELMIASYCYADDSGGDWRAAGAHVDNAINIAIENKWPHWALERMFHEIKPLVRFNEFCTRLINELYARVGKTNG